MKTFPFRTIISSSKPSLARYRRRSCELSSTGVKTVNSSSVQTNSSKQFERRLRQVSSQVQRLKQVQQEVFTQKQQITTKLQSNLPQNATPSSEMAESAPDQQSTTQVRQIPLQNGQEKSRDIRVSSQDRQNLLHSESKQIEPAAASEDQLFKVPALPKGRRKLKTPQTVKQMTPASSQQQTTLQCLPSEQLQKMTNQDQMLPLSSKHQYPKSISSQSGMQDQQPKQMQPLLSSHTHQFKQPASSQDRLSDQMQQTPMQVQQSKQQLMSSVMIESNHQLPTFETNNELVTDCINSNDHKNKVCDDTPSTKSEVEISSHRPEIATLSRKSRARSTLRRKRKKPKHDVDETPCLKSTCSVQQSVDSYKGNSESTRDDGHKTSTSVISNEPPQRYFKLVYDEYSNKWIRHEIITDYKHLDEEKSKAPPRRMRTSDSRSWPKEGPHKVRGRKTDMLKMLLPTALICTNTSRRIENERQLAESLNVTDPLRIELHKRKMPIVPGHYQEHIYKFGKLPFRNNPR